ncbi:MAG: hypothetical protein K5892_00195 [Acholeplasmatales bacterium]|nr:hypothetical protein [Acholeplasmatales bacterium]
MSKKDIAERQAERERQEVFEKERQMQKKRKRKLTIIIAILAVISIAVVVEYIVEILIWNNNPDNVKGTQYIYKHISFFAKHFSLAISMALVGTIAMMLVKANRGESRFSQNKGEDLMVVVSLLLYLCAIAALIIPFIW